ALAVLLAGCGSGTPKDAAPASYPTGRTSVAVAAGDDFSLTVAYNASLGEAWYVVDPGPDRAVLRARGPPRTRPRR
ncbi:hypothetical protein J0695_41135, partial [Streptomyces beijiangensis]|nr:hypothetical protein [Streptomyces beijiangensis]